MCQNSSSQEPREDVVLDFSQAASGFQADMLDSPLWAIIAMAVWSHAHASSSMVMCLNVQVWLLPAHLLLWLLGPLHSFTKLPPQTHCFWHKSPHTIVYNALVPARWLCRWGFCNASANFGVLATPGFTSSTVLDINTTTIASATNCTVNGDRKLYALNTLKARYASAAMPHSFSIRRGSI